MTSRVLVADDSLTIQKVIGITLANSGYELVECLNEADLLKKIHSEHFDLILLDFNLSDSHSGYELSKQINHALPNAAIIVMLGTFDTVDESQFGSCGIADKIVKPFESTKFIKKCRDLLEGNRPEVLSHKVEVTSEEDFSPSDDVDLWTVEAPKILAKEEVQDEVISHHEERNLDPLSSEIEGWGFTTSLEEKYQKVFPPVIEEESEEVNVIERLQTSSQFIQEADFSASAEEDLDITEPTFVLPQDLNRDLLSEIDEDISPETFWAVDEVAAVKSDDEDDIEATNLGEITADLTDSLHAFRATEEVNKSAASAVSNASKASKVSQASNEEISFSHVNMDELTEKLKVSLRPMIEEMIKEFCRQSAEKVAWEVIPDLAENLIRKEIKDISESVKH